MSAVCGFSTCEASITITPAGTEDWAWRDSQGSTVGTNYPPGFESPAFWQDLKENDIAAYSMLNARDQLCMTGWSHQHYPSPGSWYSPFASVVVDCCEVPMHLQPRGWACRVGCGKVVLCESLQAA